MSLKVHYEIEASCDDCGKDIEECFFTNKKNEIVHGTTETIGHYYLDGTTRCEACHEANR